MLCFDCLVFGLLVRIWRAENRGYEKSHTASVVSGEVDFGAWQDGAGGQETGGSSGLVRGTAGYMRLRKESLVCLFTCHTTTKLCLHMTIPQGKDFRKASHRGNPPA